MIPPPPPEFIWSMVAIAIGSGVAVYMAARRTPQTEEDVMTESLYDKNVAPEQEKNHPDLVAEIRATARRLAAGGREITTDDIHEVLTLPPGVDPRILGTAFIPRKDWIKGSYRPTRRKAANSRPIPAWTLREAVDAE